MIFPNSLPSMRIGPTSGCSLKRSRHKATASGKLNTSGLAEITSCSDVRCAVHRAPTSFLPAVAYTRGRLAALHRPILRMAIDRGAVAPVESLAVEFRWAAPKFF